jgi:hypothetical protein
MAGVPVLKAGAALVREKNRTRTRMWLRHMTLKAGTSELSSQGSLSLGMGSRETGGQGRKEASTPL